MRGSTVYTCRYTTSLLVVGVADVLVVSPSIPYTHVHVYVLLVELYMYIRTCRREEFAIRGEGEGVDDCLVASEYPDTVSADDIP